MAKGKSKPKPPPLIPADYGTKATQAYLRRDPVDDYAAGLRKRGDRLVGEKESAAREIRRVYMMVTGKLWARAVDVMRGDRGSAEPAAEWLAIAHRDRYKPWADEMGRSGLLALVMDWLIDEHTMSQIDRDRRQRKGRAFDVIDSALLRYAENAGWAGRVARVA